MTRHLLAGAALLGLIAMPILAAGSGPAPPPSMPRQPAAPPPSPQERAAMKYNDGLKQQEKGDELAREAATLTDEKQRAKTETQAQKAYGKAKGNFEAALGLDPGNFQAHAALGYVLRRMGDFDASLKSYGQALTLKPGYPPAVEYRAEAYLGLNRIEDAKTAYIDLFSADRKHADMLAEAMTQWIGKRRQDPAGVDPAVVEEFATWLSQRQEIARQTTALLPAGNDRW